MHIYNTEIYKNYYKNNNASMTSILIIFFLIKFKLFFI